MDYGWGSLEYGNDHPIVVWEEGGCGRGRIGLLAVSINFGLNARQQGPTLLACILADICIVSLSHIKTRYTMKSQILWIYAL